MTVVHDRERICGVCYPPRSASAPPPVPPDAGAYSGKGSAPSSADPPISTR
jgi:hypothetical protein